MRTFFALLLAFTSAACGTRHHGSAGIPDSVMVNVLYDLHMAGARINADETGSSDARDAVLSRHRLSEQQYRRAMRYYARNQQEYVMLYDEVVRRLEDRANSGASH